MKPLLLTIALIGTTLTASEPVEFPKQPIAQGTYVLSKNDEGPGKSWELAKIQVVEIKKSDSGVLILEIKDDLKAVITEEKEYFTITQKHKDESGVWITTYIGSLQSPSDAIFYGGSYTTIYYYKTEDARPRIFTEQGRFTLVGKFKAVK